jgi:hypothetical protein
LGCLSIPLSSRVASHGRFGSSQSQTRRLVIDITIAVAIHGIGRNRSCIHYMSPVNLDGHMHVIITVSLRRNPSGKPCRIFHECCHNHADPVGSWASRKTDRASRPSSSTSTAKIRNGVQRSGRDRVCVAVAKRCGCRNRKLAQKRVCSFCRGRSSHESHR